MALKNNTKIKRIHSYRTKKIYYRKLKSRKNASPKNDNETI